MNNKAIIGGVVIIIILAVGGYLMMQRGTLPGGTAGESTGSGTGQDSLKALLTRNGSQKCEVSYFQSSGVTSQGTVYVNSGKMRGDFTTEVQGQSHTAHMLIDNATVYTWVDGLNMGYKMQVQASSTAENQMDLNQRVNYNCANWSPDNNLFAVPADINFTDSTSLGGSVSPNPSGGTPSGSAAQCNACNQLSSATQAQCKAALNCK